MQPDRAATLQAASPAGTRGIQGCLAHKKLPPPSGPPQGPRHRPTVEPWEEVVSFERGNPEAEDLLGRGISRFSLYQAMVRHNLIELLRFKQPPPLLLYFFFITLEPRVD